MSGDTTNLSADEKFWFLLFYLYYMVKKKNPIKEPTEQPDTRWICVGCFFLSSFKKLKAHI